MSHAVSCGNFCSVTQTLAHAIVQMMPSEEDRLDFRKVVTPLPDLKGHQLLSTEQCPHKTDNRTPPGEQSRFFYLWEGHSRWVASALSLQAHHFPSTGLSRLLGRPP